MRAKAADWTIAQDSDKGRRVVPSPRPLAITDTRVLRLLLEQSVIVICGGGIPVLRPPDGSLTGIEAAIDKDASSALLARKLDTDALLLLTDVDAVYRSFGIQNEAPIGLLTPAEARALDLPTASMGPKAKAAADFASQGGSAGIGRLTDAVAILKRQAGTVVAQIRA